MLADRLHRRHPTVPDGRALRPLQRHRTDRSILRPDGPPPAQPQREPPPEPRDPHRRARTDQPRHARPRLLPRQTNPREITQRSHALPQTTDQRRRLPPTPRRHQPLNNRGPGGQPGTTLESSAAGESLKPALRNSHSRTRTPRYDQTHPHATGVTTRARTPPPTPPLDTNRLRSGVI